MSRSRVIFLNRVYRPSTAATAQLLTDLAEALAARGRDVHVIATGDGDAVHAGVTLHVTGPTRPHDGRLAQARNYRAYLRAAVRQLERLVKPGDVVVPMTDPPLLASAATPVAQARGAAVVHWIQDIYPEILRAHLGAWLTPFVAPLRWRRDRAWRAAFACVPVGGDMAAPVLRAGVAPDRVHCLQNWAPRELETPVPESARQSQRHAWGLSKEFVVAYSGNLGRVHEFATVLAAADLLRHDTGISFLFIGSGPRLDEIRREAAARRLDRVRFLPPCPRAELPASLAGADAHLVTLDPRFAHLVNPSKIAGILAVGRPVLLVGPTDGEMARLLARAGCGATLACGDGAGLARTIREWRDDPAGTAARGQHARLAYRDGFTLAGAVARWESLLDTAR